MSPALSNAASGVGLCAAGMPIIKLIGCLMDITVLMGTG